MTRPPHQLANGTDVVGPHPRHGEAAPAGEDAGDLARALGRELAEARRGLDWTQCVVAGKAEVSTQTIACYEAGTRHFSVIRFVVLCRVLRQRPDELLRRAIDTAIGRGPGATLMVDLAALTASGDPTLLPLRRWASVRARQHRAGEPAVEQLDLDAVTALAVATGTTVEQLWPALAGIATTANATGAEMP